MSPQRVLRIVREIITFAALSVAITAATSMSAGFIYASFH